MKARARTITDRMLRDLHNSARDGTINDAIVRLDCRIALAERCIHDDMPGDGLRYPTADEIRRARARCAEIWNRRHTKETP